MEKNLLEAEIQFFEAKRKELLAKARNEYALIHGRELAGTFVSKEDAVKRGYELYGNVPFLVKQIVEKDRTLIFPSGLVRFK